MVSPAMIVVGSTCLISMLARYAEKLNIEVIPKPPSITLLPNACVSYTEKTGMDRICWCWSFHANVMSSRISGGSEQRGFRPHDELCPQKAKFRNLRGQEDDLQPTSLAMFGASP
ncbi:hypothetical protein B0J18DRAFT_424753 [Chaetomium sp. MPI-SDFR-AT-0129]|nr:hypothetical protein B0J18DRAFT_424753 [Chaetomium sp. MPI-SDFR-AT-0129]